MSNDTKRKFIEGFWDCKYCSQTKIGGNQRVCPHCGHTRDKDTRFYMTEAQKKRPIYVGKEEAKKAMSGPDWECKFCRTLNSATLTECESCGASRTEDCKDYFQLKKEEQKKEVASTSETHIPESVPPKNDIPEPEPIPEPVITPDPEPEPVQEPEPYTPSNYDEDNRAPTFFDIVKKIARSIAEFFIDNLPGIVITCLIVGCIVGVIYGCIWLFRPHYKTVQIDHTFWEYTIEVEQIRTVSENSWTLPDGAKNVTTKSEVYTHKKVFDHNETKSRQVKKERIARYETKVTGYKDLGNGYFEEITERVPVYETYYETEYYTEPVYRREPVYKDKYYYDIDRWFFYRNLTTSGIDSKVQMPDTSDLKDDERTGAHKSSYSFCGTDEEGVTETYDVSYSDWENLESGDLLTVKYNKAGNILSITEQE